LRVGAFVVGDFVGAFVESLVGTFETGVRDGNLVGETVGRFVGISVGAFVGTIGVKTHTAFATLHVSTVAALLSLHWLLLLQFMAG
jgi:hypothetical protein